MATVSKIEYRLVMEGKGEGKINVYRHLAPVTVNAMLMQQILAGRVTRFQDTFVYAPLGIRVGVEKARKVFKKGEIAFMSSAGAICFFLKDANVGVPMNPVGEVVEGKELIEKLGPGDTVQLIKA